jgi:hypothetical protein
MSMVKPRKRKRIEKTQQVETIEDEFYHNSKMEALRIPGLDTRPGSFLAGSVFECMEAAGDFLAWGGD